MKKVADDSEAEGFLGPVELACRSRTGWDGQDVVQLVMGLPFLAFFAFLAGAGLTTACGYEPPVFDVPLFYVLFVVFFGLFGYLVYVAEKIEATRILAAHRDGVRYGRTAILYEDIAALHQGLGPSKAFPTLSKIAMTKASVRAAVKSAFTIEMVTGKKLTLKGVTRRYVIDDLTEVLHRIADKSEQRAVIESQGD